EEQLQLLRRGTAEIVTEAELAAKLERAAASGRPLRVKLGLDPSAPDIHLGHTVVLRKLRQFQDLGHEVYCLIGDFTGRIGDPSGRSETRRQLSEEEVRSNAATYARQVFRILDPARTRIVFNSQWLASLRFVDVVRLASRVTVARMLEREDFAQRFRSGHGIHLHEFFYPLMQGYDSVALEADVELGGTDQRFNLMMARDIQREYGQEAEVAIMTPILEGIDGVQKMSKSLGNYIGVEEPPREMYGKLMRIPDHLVPRYLELLTDVPLAEVREAAAAMATGRVNPRHVKARLAREVVGRFHGEAAAAQAAEEFDRVFRLGGLPDAVPEVVLEAAIWAAGRLPLAHLLTRCGLAASHSEARRKIAEGAVRVDGERVTDPQAEVALAPGLLLQIGKRRHARLAAPGQGGPRPA
ncbi:MAG: tyrosine--tRNA ligase, partial [Clostridia bacterium]|nr:tyrosine--tRNA ligase [Clostridia bacterium]